MADGKKFIREIEIENFKGFEKLKLEGISNFNLFVGGNNIGKTSVLEALATLFGFLPKQFLQIFLNELRSENLEKIQDFNMFFHNYDLANSIGLSSSFANGNKIKLKIKHKNELYMEQISCKFCDENHSNEFIEWNITKKTDHRNRDTQNTDPIAKALEHAISQHERGFTSSFSKDKNLASYGQFDNKFIPIARFIHRNVHLEKEEVDLIRAKSSKQTILDFIKKIDLRIEDIIVDNDLALLYQKNVDKPIPINHLGIGFIKILRLYLAILVNGIDIILFDEITDGLSPKTVRILLEHILPLLVEHKIQLFSTTHSWDILSCIAKYDGENSDSFLAIYKLDRVLEEIQVRKIPFLTVQNSFPDFIDFREEN